MNVLIGPGVDRKLHRTGLEELRGPQPQGLRDQRVGPLWMLMNYPLGEGTGRRLKECLAKVPVLNP